MYNNTNYKIVKTSKENLPTKPESAYKTYSRIRLLRSLNDGTIREIAK